VVKAKDTPGFIVNKVARPFYSESIRMYEEGMATPAEIDTALKEVGGFRMGPFELTDFIGHDVNYKVTETVWKSFFNDGRYTPSFTQQQLVLAGYLGRKSGQGFYTYPNDNKPAKVNKDKATAIVNRVIIMLINEAADTVHRQIATIEDIDIAMTKGVNYPKGLLKWADELGIEECVRRMDILFDEYHEDRYRCSPLLRKMLRKGHQFYEA
jgi:3-hydroxybutyryl-CoA dehydrogenase